MKKLVVIFMLSLLILPACAEVDLSDAPQASLLQSFEGEKGEFREMSEDGISFEVSSINDGNAHYFHTRLDNEREVYFFLVKSPDGKLRAAANGCQVCGTALQGFRQEGEYMVCNTCGNSYPLNKIATEKGGCNPAPIDPDLVVQDGKVMISRAQLEDIEQYFYF